MSLNIDLVLKDMGFAIIDSVKDDVVDIKNYTDTILQNNKESLKELAEAWIADEISDSVFDAEVEREKKVVETEILTINLMEQAAAQQAANSAINVFLKAVKAVV